MGLNGKLAGLMCLFLTLPVQAGEDEFQNRVFECQYFECIYPATGRPYFSNTPCDLDEDAKERFKSRRSEVDRLRKIDKSREAHKKILDEEELKRERERAISEADRIRMEADERIRRAKQEAEERIVENRTNNKMCEPRNKKISDIKKSCSDKWDENFDMIDHCVQSNMKAFRKLCN